MPLDKIRDILGQVDEKTTLGYIYNPNTEQENLDIIFSNVKKVVHIRCTYQRNKKSLENQGIS
jgi:hypothetical protein